MNNEVQADTERQLTGLSSLADKTHPASFKGLFPPRLVWAKCHNLQNKSTLWQKHTDCHPGRIHSNRSERVKHLQHNGASWEREPAGSLTPQCCRGWGPFFSDLTWSRFLHFHWRCSSVVVSVEPSFCPDVQQEAATQGHLFYKLTSKLPECSAKQKPFFLHFIFQPNNETAYLTALGRI